MRLFIAILVIASLACTRSMANIQPTASVTTEAIRELSDNTPANEPLIVIAEKALRLREYPDGKEVTIMPKDSQVNVISCLYVGETLWAYVKYENLSGWSAARYISGACNKGR